MALRVWWACSSLTIVCLIFLFVNSNSLLNYDSHFDYADVKFPRIQIYKQSAAFNHTECCLGKIATNDRESTTRLIYDRKADETEGLQGGNTCMTTSIGAYHVCVSSSSDRSTTNDQINGLDYRWPSIILEFSVVQVQLNSSTPVLIPGLVDFITTVKASGGAFGSLATERLGVGSVRSRLTIPPLIAAGERLELSVKPIYINFMETEHPSYDWINEGWPFGIVGHQRILVDSIPELFRMNIQIKNEGVVDCNPGQFSNGLWLPRRNQSSALSLITGKYVWISDGCLRSHQVLNETTFGLQDTFPATELGRCLKTRATRLAVFGDSITRNFWEDWAFFLTDTYPSGDFNMFTLKKGRHEGIKLKHPSGFDIDASFTMRSVDLESAIDTHLIPTHCAHHDVIVLGHGLHDVFVTPWMPVETSLRRALTALAQACPAHIQRGAIFFLVMPSTSDQYSSRVRPRAYEWTRRVVPIFTEFGIKPLDTWHPTDARLLDAAPTQSDGTHWGRRQTKGHSSEVGMSFVVNLIQQLCPEGRAPPEVSAATGDL